MANRAIQAKILKIKKQRRAWARPLMVASGIRPNMDVVKGYKERAKGLAVSDAEVDELYRRLFKRDPWKGDGPARRAVLKILADMREQTPEFLFFTVVENTTRRCRVYFNSQKTCFFLVHEDFRNRILRRSLTFASKEAAIRKWHMDQVIWVEHSQLPEPESG